MKILVIGGSGFIGSKLVPGCRDVVRTSITSVPVRASWQLESLAVS